MTELLLIDINILGIGAMREYEYRDRPWRRFRERAKYPLGNPGGHRLQADFDVAATIPAR